jgi:hypothetical protein
MSTLEDLIPTLLEKTQEGKLKWEDLSSGSFLVGLGSNSFELSTPKIGGGIRLALLDEGGRRLESVTYADLTHPRDATLAELHEIVRRKALRIDEQLADVKAKLDKL